MVAPIQDRKSKCSGSKARKLIGFKDEHTPVRRSDLKGNRWKYVFIQSTSQLQILPEGSHFIFGKIAQACYVI